MAARTSLMHRASDSSVTTACGQTAATISSFAIKRPAFSTRYRRTREALGPQLYLAVCGVEAAPREIQRAGLEAIKHGAIPACEGAREGSQDFRRSIKTISRFVQDDDARHA